MCWGLPMRAMSLNSTWGELDRAHHYDELCRP